jgi:hypothetical protein
MGGEANKPGSSKLLTAALAPRPACCGVCRLLQ